MVKFMWSLGKNGICMGALCHMKIVAISWYVKDHQSLHVSNYHALFCLWNLNCIDCLFATCWYNLYLLMKTECIQDIKYIYFHYSILVDTIYTCWWKCIQDIKYIYLLFLVIPCSLLVDTIFTCRQKESVSSVSTCYSVFSISSASPATQTA